MDTGTGPCHDMIVMSDINIISPQSYLLINLSRIMIKKHFYL